MAKGETHFVQGESHGLSVFLRVGDSVFHTYSAYARGAGEALRSNWARQARRPAWAPAQRRRRR